MFAVRAARFAPRVISRRFAAEAHAEPAAAAHGNLVLNFNLPHESIYDGKQVAQVIVPGVAGEYGVTANHSPIVAQMKAGVLQIIHLVRSYSLQTLHTPPRCAQP